MRRPPPAEALWSVPRCWPGETVVVFGGGESLSDEQVEYVREAHAADRCRAVAINRAHERAPWADWLYGCDPGWFWAWCSGPQRLRSDIPDALAFMGIKISLWSDAESYANNHGPHVERLIGAGVKLLRHHGEGWHTGVSEDPAVWVRGNNSFYQLLSGPLIATGAARVIALGIDMRGGHWHARWPMADLPYEAEGTIDVYDKDRLPRQYRAAIEVGGRDVELGWYAREHVAREVEAMYAEHIAAGCPNPDHKLSGIIPRFATLLPGLEAAGVEVINCSPGSALKTFPQARLEDVL